MTHHKKLFLNWSSGKDAALALYKLQKSNKFQVDLLLTTVTMPQNRISMHGIRRELLELQLKQIGIPSLIIELPEMPHMDTYHSIMDHHLDILKKQQFKYGGSGDILLVDVKKYRENLLKPFAMKGVFPLWKRNTKEILEEFLETGFKAIIVSSNAILLDKSFCGRIIDKTLIKDLPEGIDACGENGEFHTFCFDGPIFKKPVEFHIGDKVYKEYKAPKNKNDTSEIGVQEKKIGFWFCDLLAG